MTKRIDNILTKLGTNNSSQIATAVLAGFKMIFLPIATATDKTASPEQKKYTIIRDIIMEGLALVTYIGVTGQIQKHATSPICSLYYKNKAKQIENGSIKPAQELSKDEIDFLKSVDSKKIKEAGNDFLTQISPNHKEISKETKIYIDKLSNIIEKINGDKDSTVKCSFDQYVTDLKNTSTISEQKSSLLKDFKSATKESIKVLKPTKVFQNTRIALSQLSVWALALAIIPPLCNAIIGPFMKTIDQTKKTTRKESIKKPQNNEVQCKNTFSTFPNYTKINTGMRI